MVLLAPFEERVEFAHGILLHTRQHMRVDIQRHTDLRKAKHLLDHLGMDTKTEQERSSTVTQVIKTNSWQICFFQQLLELIDFVN